MSTHNICFHGEIFFFFFFFFFLVEKSALYRAMKKDLFCTNRRKCVRVFRVSIVNS